MDLYDLDENDIFRWQGEIYRLIGINDDGVATVVCIARKKAMGFFGFIEKTRSETFNAYNDEIDPLVKIVEVSDDDLTDITCKNGTGIEISISEEGDRIWLNSNEGVCLVRICNIQEKIEIVDKRKKK